MLIKDLPDNGLMELAIERFLEQMHAEKSFILESHINSFAWSATDEGYDFWDSIDAGDFSVYPYDYDRDDQWNDEHDYEDEYDEENEDELEDSPFYQGDDYIEYNNYLE